MATRIGAFGGLEVFQMSPACGTQQSWLLATTGVAASLAVARPVAGAERVAHLPLLWRPPGVAELFKPSEVLAVAGPGEADPQSCFHPGRR